VVPLDARCSIQTSAAGDVWIDASHMHLFEPASGDDLTLA